MNCKQMSFIKKLANHELITGYPGSGKSTLAKAYAKKKNMPYVELDSFIDSLGVGKQWEKPHQNVPSMTPEELETIRSSIGKLQPSVIEGTQLFNKPDSIKDLAEGRKILLNTPRKLSMQRKAQRSLSKHPNYQYPLISWLYKKHKMHKDKPLFDAMDKKLKSFNPDITVPGGLEAEDAIKYIESQKK